MHCVKLTCVRHSTKRAHAFGCICAQAECTLSRSSLHANATARMHLTVSARMRHLFVTLSPRATHTITRMHLRYSPRHALCQVRDARNSYVRIITTHMFLVCLRAGRMHCFVSKTARNQQPLCVSSLSNSSPASGMHFSKYFGKFEVACHYDHRAQAFGWCLRAGRMHCVKSMTLHRSITARIRFVCVCSYAASTSSISESRATQIFAGCACSCRHRPHDPVTKFVMSEAACFSKNHSAKLHSSDLLAFIPCTPACTLSSLRPRATESTAGIQSIVCVRFVCICSCRPHALCQV